jgi:cation diffusion facilitator CzcD-associated flavoprotein CzcO
MLLKNLARELPPGYDIGTHFTPRYNPWDQRFCAVPNGDLFKAISDGSASVATDHITSFTENGLLLESGSELEADVIVTATGLELLFLGGIVLSVDGAEVDLPSRLTYKGLMRAPQSGRLGRIWTDPGPDVGLHPAVGPLAS